MCLYVDVHKLFLLQFLLGLRVVPSLNNAEVQGFYNPNTGTDFLPLIGEIECKYQKNICHHCKEVYAQFKQEQMGKELR